MVRDENTKPLTEYGEWARDEVTMDRAGKSVLLYSFVKDGQARGERIDDKISHIESGQTFNILLNEFMFEEKKTSGAKEGSRNVFPADLDFIPAFTVVEIALNPANSGNYDEGWGVNVARIRPCPFTLYSMLNPLGLELLPSSYEASVALGEAGVQLSPGLKRVLETKNSSFFSKVTQGSYLVKHGIDTLRLVGPKVDPADPLSRHLDVMPCGVFAIDIAKKDLLSFTNAMEEEEEDGLVYAQCLVDLASSAGALSCYVVHNEYLLRKDPNRSPFMGVPLIDSNKLLECIQFTSSATDSTRFQLPFPVVNMDKPYLDVDLACIDNNSAGDSAGTPLACPDFVLASENAGVRCAYPLALGDAVESDFMRILFVPKSVSGSSGSGSAGGGGLLVGGRAGLERTDYRLLKKRRVGSAPDAVVEEK